MKIKTNRGYIVTDISNVVLEYRGCSPYSPVNQNYFLIVQGLEYEISEEEFDYLEKRMNEQEKS